MRDASPTWTPGQPSQAFSLPRPLVLSVLAKPRCVKASHRRRCRVASRVWLPGQYFDAESGLNYNVDRDYEAASGRCIQSDPMGVTAGPTTYGYVSGNSLLAWDELGLVRHTTGKTVDCGGGCTIRIDYTFDEATQIKSRHLHWDCKGQEGSCGENGNDSHDGSWDDVKRPRTFEKSALAHASPPCFQLASKVRGRFNPIRLQKIVTPLPIAQ
ncbi:RHS repeat-associated core domain-containing protein [Luteibacter sp. Sphag1AF]|uniref:RHS repeat-associated core domain-containing protein n=1 Tax=Luteibacter sp. Sphag1AF TaxID=2587031 RepID=UPI0031B854F7